MATKSRKRKRKRMVKLGLAEEIAKRNKEGYPSYERTDEENFLIMLLTNQLRDTFYAKAKGLTERSIELHKKVVGEKEFYARALIFARNLGYQRLQPQLGLVNLSVVDIRLFKKIFNKVCRIPTDMRDFIDFSKADIFRTGLGSGVKKTMIRWLRDNLSEYYAIKYRQELKDTIRLCRPSEFDLGGKNSRIVDWIMGNERERARGEELPQIDAYENLKRARTKSRRMSLIEKGRLPHEAVTPFIKTNEEWKVLAEVMPIFALLRHLNTLRRHGCFTDRKFVNMIYEKLTNEEVILNSKIFPFRFYSAYKMLKEDLAEEYRPDRDVPSDYSIPVLETETDIDEYEEDDTAVEHIHYKTPNKILEGLAVAYATSFKNLPRINGDTMVIIDTSSSMDGQYKEVAATLGLGIASRCRIKYILCFDTELHSVPLRANPLDMVEEICETGGGGTHLGLPIMYMTDERIRVDNIVVISDMEEWIDTSFMTNLRNYKRRVNPDVKTFLINVSPYEDYPTPADEPNVYTIGGWSEQVINFMSAISMMNSYIDKVGKTDIESRDR